MAKRTLNISVYIYFEGVKIFEGIGVKGVQTEDDRVSSVQTTNGDIKCDYFVNCTGMVSL